MASDRWILGLAALAGVAACGASGPVANGTPGCSEGVKPEPIANLGPDLTLHGACGGVARGAVASVSESAGGLLNWNARIAGDPYFDLEMFGFTSCASSPPQVARVRFSPPLSAKPGDGFDAVVTISAAHDAFPTGTVKVHGEVGAPVVTVDHKAIDFGDVVIDSQPTAKLEFRNESQSPLTLLAPTNDARLPFLFGSSVLLPGSGAVEVSVGLRADTLGDSSTTAVWTATTLPNDDLPPGCATMISTPLHVRVVPPDGGSTD